MPPRKTPPAGGLFSGLTELIEKLGELAEKGEELRKSGAVGDPEKIGAVFGIKVSGLGLGTPGDGLKVEPFGNVKPDAGTGRPTVQEVTEPPVDVFEEPDHVLVLVELPGVGPEDVSLELTGDVLKLRAASGRRKYAKDVELPCSPPAEKMVFTCRNGVLEVKLPLG